MNHRHRGNIYFLQAFLVDDLNELEKNYYNNHSNGMGTDQDLQHMLDNFFVEHISSSLFQPFLSVLSAGMFPTKIKSKTKQY
jgi:hypothetical protein